MGRGTVRRMVEGLRRRYRPSVSGCAAATSPCLRHRGDLPCALPPIEPASMRPPMPPLDPIDSWIFDHENPLYATSAKLFELITETIGAFLMRLLKVDA